MARRRPDLPWVNKLFDLLDDQEWHDYADILHISSLEVPEDLAEKKGEYYRSYHYRKAGHEVAERRSGGQSETIKTGQRFVVSKVIQRYTQQGLLEIEYDNTTVDRRRKRPHNIRLAVPGG
jgi:hypothetical protein